LDRAECTFIGYAGALPAVQEKNAGRWKIAGMAFFTDRLGNG